MELCFGGHAQLLVVADGGRLLIDPWFAEPVFGQAWWRYPPPPWPTPDDVGGIDALALSHIHPDHSGPGTLAMLDPNLPTAHLPFPPDRLGRRIAAAGYTAVTRCEAWVPHTILPGIDITFVPHDRGWEVASIVIACDGVRIYHGNDNTLSVAAYREVAERLGPIDIAFLPFAGASSYPTGFGWKGDDLAAKAADKKRQGIKRFTNGLEGLRPRRAVPFASSWALLDPDELWKNYLDRPTPEETVAAAGALAAEVGAALTVMAPGDRWSPDGGFVATGATEGWTTTAEDVARYAASRADDVAAASAKRQGLEGTPPTPETLDRAVKSYFPAMFAAMADTTAKLTMRATFTARWPDATRSWSVLFEPGKPPALSDGADAAADETLLLEAGELMRLLSTEDNWEDPWYGYRLEVRKREGAGYYRAFWEMLLNFDDGAASHAVAELLA